jgi:hypothetical protein
MPRLDYQAQLDRFGYDTRMLMTLLVQEVNTLRQAAGLPQRTPEQIRQAIRNYQRTNPRPATFQQEDE